MKKRLLILFLTIIAVSSSFSLFAQQSNNRPLRIIVFGAHPDDAEMEASGVAAMWAKQGHKVKFVSMTNGDIGHFRQAGGPLAIRRAAEVQECARILGIETQVLDIHDGELMPTLENRKKVARLIRDWQADIVICHRTNDYHPDHRYTGVLVQDATVLVAAPFFTPDSPPVKDNPILMYGADNFTKPNPFEPTIVIGIDEVAEKKWDCIRAMPSQFRDADSWVARYFPGVPQGDNEKERGEFIVGIFKKRMSDIADKYRDRLVELYGRDKGSKFKYAEAFELSEYGRQVTVEELKKLFPTFR